MITLQLKFRPLIAFFFLMILLGEMHELVHIFTGYSFCGCWGARDFNVWSLCEGCRDANPWAILATFAGPIFTFALIWLGRAWLLHGDTRKQVLGFILIFANLPFARILTAFLGGGDEVYALHVVFGNGDNRDLIHYIGLSIVLVAAVPPLITAWKAIANPYRWLYFLGFLLLPMLLAMLVIFMGLNGLLEQGVLAEPWIWGTPALVTLNTMAMIIGLSLMSRYLVELRKNE